MHPEIKTMTNDYSSQWFILEIIFNREPVFTLRALLDQKKGFQEVSKIECLKDLDLLEENKYTLMSSKGSLFMIKETVIQVLGPKETKIRNLDMSSLL